MNIKFVVRVIGELSRNKDTPITILQISKNTKLSYNAANRTVHALIKEGIIESTTIGHSNILKLKDSAKTKGFIALAEAYQNE